MNKLSFAALAVTLVCTFMTASAQSEQEMKAMMAYATPGDIHKMMARSVGTWAGNITMWMEPGAPPMTSVGEAKMEMILGGRYLQSTNTGNYAGMPFEGISITGYDNAKKAFFNTWIDNMGTGIMVLAGKWDEASKSIRFSGTMVDPASGKDLPVKETLTFVDEKTQVMEMYSSAGGKEFKTMEIKFTLK